MSWPHILSFSRILAGPIVAALVLAGSGDAYLAAAVIFAVASITDLVDGKLARYSESVSPLGVFLDTTSDKVMVSVVLVALSLSGLSPAWITLAIIGREFVISGLRSYAASCNRIISAHIWGKGKAAVTMVAIVITLLAADGRASGVLGSFGSHQFWTGAVTIAMWGLGLSAVLTLISGARYVIDAWPLFQNTRTVTEVRPESTRRIAAGDRR